MDGLPESIKELTSLEYLNLDGNKFNIFPEELTSIKSLKELNISANMISTLPDSLLNMPNLRRICLNNNPIDHNHEETKHVMDAFKERNILFQVRRVTFGGVT